MGTKVYAVTVGMHQERLKEMQQRNRQMSVRKNVEDIVQLLNGTEAKGFALGLSNSIASGVAGGTCDKHYNRASWSLVLSP